METTQGGPNRMLVLASGLVLLGALIAGGLWLQRAMRKEPAPPPSAPQQQPQLPPPTLPIEAVTAAPLDQGPHDKQPHLTYPDGSSWPPLNGVKSPAPVAWPQGHPFAPVVGKIRDAMGVEFYKHADGSLSTTMMMFRKDLGRDDAITQVYLPVAPSPVVVDGDNKPLPPSPRRN
jgi:hypothetical protein